MTLYLSEALSDREAGVCQIGSDFTNRSAQIASLISDLFVYITYIDEVEKYKNY